MRATQYRMDAILEENDQLRKANESLRQQAILRDLEIVRLREALLNVRHDMTMVSGCFMDSIETHGTQGGWLDDEAAKLNVCISEIDASISTPIDLSALARHDEEIVGPWKRDAERYRVLRDMPGNGNELDADIDTLISDADNGEKD